MAAATSTRSRARLVHEPIHPVRTGLAGEVVFATRWRKAMAAPNAFREVLMFSGQRATPRAARVAASFITWLGTHIGQCFLLRAKRLAKGAVLSGPEAYLAAWSLANQRRSHTNSGRRSLEHLVQTKDYPLDPYSSWSGEPPSVDDYEVVDATAAWLGSKDGQAFLAACADESAAMEKRDSLVHHLTHNLHMTAEAASRMADGAQSI